MDREQAKWVVFNSIKKKLKKLEPIDDIQELFDKETWRKNFIDWLYDNGFVLIAPPEIEFEDDIKDKHDFEIFKNTHTRPKNKKEIDEMQNKQSKFMEESNKIHFSCGDGIVEGKFYELIDLIDKHKEDKQEGE